MVSASSGNAVPEPENDERDWPRNYYNYFTEIEDHFRAARGSGLFMLSPLDWALIETWKNSGVPLPAALRGIDVAFEKWHARKTKTQAVNSLAFCTQAVMKEAEIMANSGDVSRPAVAEPAFAADDVVGYLRGNAEPLRRKADPIFQEIAAALDRLAADADPKHLEELEQRLSALEDRMLGALRAQASEDQLFSIRRDMDTQLKPYRGKMTADQLIRLERQFIDRRLVEDAGLRRLSLFYM